MYFKIRIEIKLIWHLVFVATPSYQNCGKFDKMYQFPEVVFWDPSNGFSIQIVPQMFNDSEEYENFHGVRNFVTYVLQDGN
ncbi:hypothetical protein BLOT_014362 [Blomia tropicalis]|nr:hypothetical protein BLOT_014362 [Blomia tropicalis]